MLWEDLPDALGRSSPPWYLVIGLPVAGAGVVVAARRLLPGDGGHRPLPGLSTEPTPVAYAPGIALAALWTLAVGYGDLVPGSDVARTFAVAEMLLGQIYLVTVVALIVGNLRPRRAGLRRRGVGRASIRPDRRPRPNRSARSGKSGGNCIRRP